MERWWLSGRWERRGQRGVRARESAQEGAREGAGREGRECREGREWDTQGVGHRGSGPQREGREWDTAGVDEADGRRGSRKQAWRGERVRKLLLEMRS